MNALVGLIKKIAVFMIAAQAVIHFAPDIKYAKYMKLIVGIMVLLQFLSPIYGIMSGMGADFRQQLSDIGQGMEEFGNPGDFTSSSSTLETVENSMEEEVKSRLNRYLLNDTTEKRYTVTNVIIELEKYPGNNDNSAEYGLKKIRVSVWENTGSQPDAASASETDSIADEEDGSMGGMADEEGGSMIGIDKVEKVQVDKVNITTQDSVKKEDTETESLRRRFCGILGMEEEYMEVIIYGVY